MISNEVARCSRVILAGAIALSPAVIPSLAQAATGNDLAIDTHLAAPAASTAVASHFTATRVAPQPATVNADHDNWWIFHNHAHTNTALKAPGSFGEGAFSI